MEFYDEVILLFSEPISIPQCTVTILHSSSSDRCSDWSFGKRCFTGDQEKNFDNLSLKRVWKFLSIQASPLTIFRMKNFMFVLVPILHSSLDKDLSIAHLPYKCFHINGDSPAYGPLVKRG
uniref:Uncharacterized protein n=1 Tax=Romanomermis culicivorax TaxID=13658 RepID=A0A915ID73_ROMCU